jgi:hypothetical protein
VGLAYDTILHLINLRRGGHLPDGAKVIEIGAQQLSNSFLRGKDALAQLYAAFDRPPVDLGTPLETNIVNGVEVQADTAPASQMFWESLGFSYSAVEYEGHRGVTSFDLNRDSVPSSMQSAFDLVVNAGTTEHVINQENAFRVMHDLAKVRGVMMHEVPGGGMMTHGVVSYNVQFFWLLCRDNNYDVLDLTVTHAGDGPISNDVIDSNTKFGRSLKPLRTRVTVPIFLISAILLKQAGNGFVTPLDVPAEALRG